MSLVTSSLSQHVQVITLLNPPVNSLGLQLRRDLVQALNLAMADPTVQAVLLTGSEKAFSAGADIKEFTTASANSDPNLLTVIDLIEHAPKLVIAAIKGTCMGGGFELALGCHYRVCSNNANFALPEIKLGLIPGAGGTQKLPRLINLEEALNIMLKGEPFGSAQAQKLGVVDQLIEGDFISNSVLFAQKLISDKKPLQRIRDSKVKYPNAQAYLDFAKTTLKAISPNYPAPLALIESLKSACMDPFTLGMQTERKLFMDLMNTPQCRALRHAFVAQRTCNKIPDIPEETPTRPINSVGVIGAGTMGGGIAMNFLNAGIPVTLLDSKEDTLKKGISIIRKNYENSQQKGKLSQTDFDARMGLLTPTLKMKDLAQCDLVIEAVFEEISVKEQVFKELDQLMKPGAILATNTSTLDVDRIASFTSRPSSVIGCHFFSPANVMKLLEVVRGKETAKEVIATIMKLSKTIKKTAVVSGVCDGFIGNRMLEHYIRMAVILVEQGATPSQVDKALENWGMIMGPFRMSDLAGNDIGWAIRKRRYIEKPQVIYSRLADAICEAGRFGQKVGQGWYKYEPSNRKPLADPAVTQIIEEFRSKNNIKTRVFTDAEIIERTIYALINEGARLLEEGIALRGSDIDVVYLTGYGFPAFRGGPMKYADEIGLVRVSAAMMRIFEESNDPFWQPASLLQKSINQGSALS